MSIPGGLRIYFKV
ncbi:uncharacterized protein FFC1_06631 [Fusarium fujikuroi]|nr:uncharacterized protein FFC1_06631 [Fusarium fujikuroi]